ncbi:MAG: hypothetical protein WD357_08865 [Gracilimonas sp.]
MNTRSTLIAITILPLIFLISCKKDSKSDTGDEFPQEMRAVWQEEGWDDGDEIGLYFNTKTMGAWDYAGDEYDQGENCYYNWEAGELISYEGNNYRIRLVDFFSDDIEELTVNIRVDGNMMTIIDPEGEDSEQEYSRDSRSIDDLTPECSDQFKISTDELKRKFQTLFSN